MLPIIQARSAQVIIVGPKTQGPYHPQLGLDSNAGAPNATGVVGYFWFVQHDVQAWFVIHILSNNAPAFTRQASFGKGVNRLHGVEEWLD